MIVAGLDAANWPEPQAIAADGMLEAAAEDGRLLYVAVTRARQNLALTASTEELSELLPANDALWNETQR